VFDHAGPVLGIDPGVSCCGYGAVERRGSGFAAVAFGVIRTAPGDPLPSRLAALSADLGHLLDEVRPAALAVERVLFQVNTRTAMSVGQASGLALALAGRAGIPVAHYSPNEVKLAVTGWGGAGKADVQTMVATLLSLAAPPHPPDAADALALALCHLWSAPLRRLAGDGREARSGLDAAVAAAIAREDR